MSQVRQQKTRVLMADKQHLIRLGIRAALANAPKLTILTEVTEEDILENAVGKQQPDVLLLASNIADATLTATLSRIKQKSPATCVLVMLSHSSEACIRNLVKSGATGCILKAESAETFMEAIRTTARGENWFSQPLMKALLTEEEMGVLSLTDTEVDVLRLVVAENTDQAIANALNVSERTVRRYLKSVYNKLGVSSRVGAAYWAGKSHLFT